jgi:hypothetical protein
MALIPSRAWGFIRVGLDGRYGVRADSLPTGGDFPALGAGTFESPGDDAVELVAVPATLPAQGELVVYSNNAYTHGPIASPPDAWTCSLFYFRSGESGAQEAVDSPFTVTDGESASYSLDAETGSFTLTGQTAELTVSRSLQADTGSFTLTGQDAAFSLGRSLAAETGAFSLTGQAADLAVSRALSADTGAFTLSGQDATLTYTPLGAYSLTAETGSFALTGQAANLAVSRALSADTGTFFLTGQDATFSKGLTLAAETGAFVLTGQDAQLSRTRVLLAEMGAYSLDGQDADLIYSGDPIPSGGGLEIEWESKLWWQRKPKKISEPEAAAKIKRVAKVIAKKAEEHAEDPAPVQQRIADIRQAVAPLVKEMPGFAWKPIYEDAYAKALDLAISQAMLARDAQEQAAQEIARIRAMDDEDVALLAMML